jgi:isopenicillin-N epimerase
MSGAPPPGGSPPGAPLPGAWPARPPRAPHAGAWALDPGVVFLNHGSFGACPNAVLEAQAGLRAEMEANPVGFLDRALEPRLDAVRSRLAAFVGSDPEDLAFVPNATHGVATILRSLRFAPGDELVATDHEYNAALNMLRVAAARDGARVVLARIPLPVSGPDEVVDRVLAAVGARTRLVLLSHVTSPTALVLPVERLVAALEARGVAVLVDGAHGPGMLPLDLEALGASFYTGNLHKWVCAPKGAAFLHVRRDRQGAIHPLAVSHGANDPRPGRSRFRKEFDWTGTADPTPFLVVPTALDTVAGLVDGGWDGVMARNAAVAAEARPVLEAATGGRLLAPAAMLGSMAAVELPADRRFATRGPTDPDPLAARLRDAAAIEVPVHAWPRDAVAGERRRRLLRVSTHLHNDPGDYAYLAEVLQLLLAEERR